MKLLTKFFKSDDITAMRAELSALQAEEIRLEAERRELLSKPLPFDDYAACALETLERINEETRDRFVWALKGRLSKGLTNTTITPGADGAWASDITIGIDYEPKRWSFLSLASNDNHTSDADAFGLNLRMLAFLLRDTIKQELPGLLEPMREAWPTKSECGPTRAERQTRLEAIKRRQAEITAIRLQYSELASTLKDAADAANPPQPALDPNFIPHPFAAAVVYPDGVRPRQ